MSSTAQLGTTFRDGAWHGVIEPGGQFPPEKGRYHLYIGMVDTPTSGQAPNLIYLVQGSFVLLRTV
jgi:hypothetical protein